LKENIRRGSLGEKKELRSSSGRQGEVGKKSVGLRLGGARVQSSEGRNKEVGEKGTPEKKVEGHKNFRGGGVVHISKKEGEGCFPKEEKKYKRFFKNLAPSGNKGKAEEKEREKERTEEEHGRGKTRKGNQISPERND